MKPMMLGDEACAGRPEHDGEDDAAMFPMMAPGILNKVMPDMIAAVRGLHRRDA